MEVGVSMRVIKYIIACCSLCLIIGFFVVSSNKNKVIDIGIEVASNVARVYRGSNIIVDSETMSNEVLNKLKGCEEKLKDTSNSVLNVEDIYNEEYSDFNTPPDITSPDDSYTAEDIENLKAQGFDVSELENSIASDSVVEDVAIVDDANIYKENGKDVIKVKDLKRDSDGNVVIDYKGVSMYVGSGKIPLQYEDIIKSKDYRFLLGDYTVSKSKGVYTVALKYTSMSGLNSLNVKVKISKGIATDIEIQLIEGDR